MKVTPLGEITTFAGVQDYQPGHQDGAAAQSRFNYPRDLVFDQKGNLYVNEYYYIRKITPDGQVSTLAGNPACCEHRVANPIKDGSGSEASFVGITDFTIGPDNSLYLVDTSNESTAVRKVSPTGVVTTVAGGSKGNTDGSAKSAQFTFLTSLTFDTKGNLYLLDANPSRLRKLDTAQQVTTLKPACQGDCPGTVNLFDNGRLLRQDGEGQVVILTSPVGMLKLETDQQVRSLFQSDRPNSGNYLEAKFRNGRISEALFNFPEDMAIDIRSGDMLVLESPKTLRRLTRQAVPIVRDFTPRSGPGDTKLTLKGYHLDQISRISLGKLPVSFQAVNGGEIEFTIPKELGYVQSTLVVTSPAGSHQVEIPFVLTESKRTLAAKHPYTGPLSLTIIDSEDKKVYSFTSPTLSSPAAAELPAGYSSVQLDLHAPGSWLSILPNKPGYRQSALAERGASMITMNQNPSGKVASGQAIISLKAPAYHTTLESRYNTQLSGDLGNFYLLAADLTKVALDQLETNLRQLNALTQNPQYVITSVSFDSLEAAKTYALWVELLLDDGVTGMSPNQLLTPG